MACVASQLTNWGWYGMGSATGLWVGFVIPYGFSPKLDAFLWPFKIHKTAVHSKDVGGFFIPKLTGGLLPVELAQKYCTVQVFLCLL